MSTSYEPHTLILLPDVGTFAVDQRVADHLLQLSARLEKAEADVVKLEKWIEMAFEAYPNLDIDVDHIRRDALEGK